MINVIITSRTVHTTIYWQYTRLLKHPIVYHSIFFLNHLLLLCCIASHLTVKKKINAISFSSAFLLPEFGGPDQRFLTWGSWSTAKQSVIFFWKGQPTMTWVIIHVEFLWFVRNKKLHDTNEWAVQISYVVLRGFVEFILELKGSLAANKFEIQMLLEKKVLLKVYIIIRMWEIRKSIKAVA